MKNRFLFAILNVLLSFIIMIVDEKIIKDATHGKFILVAVIMNSFIITATILISFTFNFFHSGVVKSIAFLFLSLLLLFYFFKFPSIFLIYDFISLSILLYCFLRLKLKLYY